ncbi:MAG: hypothetical protein ACREQQ_09815, partial [Candidatus Binatia bacterium]
MAGDRRFSSARRARGLAVLVGFGAAALLTEAGLRVFAPQPLGLSSLTPEGITLHIPNAEIRYRRSEFDHVVETNSLGLRDREIARRKPPGTFR